MERIHSILVLTCLLAILIPPASALNLPHPMTGIVYQPNGRDYAIGASVLATNQRTGDSILDVVAASGYYENIDAGNFPSGYETGDQVLIQVTWEGARYKGEIDVRIDTSPVQITEPLTLRLGYVPEAVYVPLPTPPEPEPVIETPPPKPIPVVYASMEPVYFIGGKPVTTTSTTLTTPTTTTNHPTPIIVHKQKSLIDKIMDWFGAFHI